MKKTYDLVVIGSGQGGTPLASAFAAEGRKAAVIERAHVGGSCINYGCTPTKRMVECARAAWTARNLGKWGVVASNTGVDMKKIHALKSEIVEMFRSGSEKRLRENKNIDLIHGSAYFSGPRTIEIESNDGGHTSIEGNVIVIDTGTGPRIPDIEGLSSLPYLTNETIMELQTVPEQLVVIGGGYIGCEFGQMFQRFGSQVTILDSAPRFLPREDEDISEVVHHILSDEGLNIESNVKVTSAGRLDDGTMEIQYASGDTGKTIKASHVLLSAGRTPNTETLQVEKAGIRRNKRGYIQTNEFLETGVESVYAIGDVKGGPAFTHISYDDYRILRDNLLNGQKRSIHDRLVPYTMFIDPELAHIGLHESEAEKAGIPFRTAEMPMSYVARAIERQKTQGKMKVITQSKNNTILGATIVGDQAGELMSMLQLAMRNNMRLNDLKEVIFTHPTMAESLNNLPLYVK